MRLKISFELWLPGSRRPVRAETDTVESHTFSRLASELASKSGQHSEDERFMSHLSHLRGLDPRTSAEFLKSI